MGFWVVSWFRSFGYLNACFSNGLHKPVDPTSLILNPVEITAKTVGPMGQCTRIVKKYLYRDEFTV